MSDTFNSWYLENSCIPKILNILDDDTYANEIKKYFFRNV